MTDAGGAGAPGRWGKLADRLIQENPVRAGDSNDPAPHCGRLALRAAQQSGYELHQGHDLRAFEEQLGIGILSRDENHVGRVAALLEAGTRAPDPEDPSYRDVGAALLGEPEDRASGDVDAVESGPSGASFDEVLAPGLQATRSPGSPRHVAGPPPRSPHSLQGHVPQHGGGGRG